MSHAHPGSSRYSLLAVSMAAQHLFIQCCFLSFLLLSFCFCFGFVRLPLRGPRFCACLSSSLSFPLCFWCSVLLLCWCSGVLAGFVGLGPRGCCWLSGRVFSVPLLLFCFSVSALLVVASVVGFGVCGYLVLERRLTIRPDLARRRS